MEDSLEEALEALTGVSAEDAAAAIAGPVVDGEEAVEEQLTVPEGDVTLEGELEGLSELVKELKDDLGSIEASIERALERLKERTTGE